MMVFLFNWMCFLKLNQSQTYSKLLKSFEISTLFVVISFHFLEDFLNILFGGGEFVFADFD